MFTAQTAAIDNGDGVAVCWTNELRGLGAQWAGHLANVIGPLSADLFVAAADKGNQSHVLAFPEVKRVLRKQDLIPDPGREGIMAELRESGSPLYEEFADSFGNQRRSGLFQWYFRSRCLDLVEQYEAERGRQYAWLVYLRVDSWWLAPHPPLHLLDPKLCWIPEGEDWKGVNDRHATCGREPGRTYFRVWDALKAGTMPVLEAANSERALKAYLDSWHMAIGRFPNIFGIVCCPDWAKCQGNPKCKDGFKYESEAEAAKRNAALLQKGWVWAQGDQGLVLAAPARRGFLSASVSSMADPITTGQLLEM